MHIKKMYVSTELGYEAKECELFVRQSIGRPGKPSTYVMSDKRERSNRGILHGVIIWLGDSPSPRDHEVHNVQTKRGETGVLAERA